MDLSSTHASLLKTVITSFDAPEEETRNAASFALGNIAAGNLSAFVPTLLSTMEAASAHDYLVSIKHLRSKTSSSTCQPSHSHSLTHLTSLPPHRYVITDAALPQGDARLRRTRRPRHVRTIPPPKAPRPEGQRGQIGLPAPAPNRKTEPSNWPPTVAA